MIESSWSPKESTGPVDFFWCFSSSLRASASSFPLASSFQNNPVACLADWCGFLPESLPLREGEGWIWSESVKNPARSGMRVWL